MSVEENDSFYQRYLEELNAPAYTCDMFGYLELFNKAASDVWGVKPEIGRTKWCGSWKLYQANGVQIQLDECPMAITIKEKRIVSEEVIVERPDGKRMNVLPHPRFIKDSTGTIIGAINILEDITALRNAENKLRETIILQFEEAAHFKIEILKSKLISLQFEKDVQKRVIELTAINGELVFQNTEKGKRAAELIIANAELAFQNEEKGKRAAELVIANDELAFQISEKGKRAAELIIANCELVFQNEEKEKRAAELIVANNTLAFENEEKEKRAAELIIANRELTFQNEEKEKRAAELIIANRELAFQNIEKGKRATELIIANEELAFQNTEKEKRASELIIINTELEAFSYVSSHDIQAPLRKIQILSSRLLEDEDHNLSEKGRGYLTRMQSAASRMTQLINDLLAFSRLSIADRKFEKTDLNKIIEEVKNELKEIIDEKNVTLEYSGLCEIEIIPFQFRQIMYNLISNALKFSTPDQYPHIIVTSRIANGIELNEPKLQSSTCYCHISVSDNGIGFDPQYAEFIFDVFHRLHGDDQYTGTGIGLAIVKKVIDNHNGIITATGVLTKGAIFNIYLPVSQH